MLQKLSCMVLFCGLSFGTANASKAPFCMNAGLVNEGWSVNGLFVQAPCSGKVAVCDAVGTRSEGWYAVEIDREKLIGYVACSVESEKPTCVRIGARSEGWEWKGEFLFWANCAGERAVCAFSGTRSEGWYAVPADGKELILWNHCSGK